MSEGVSSARAKARTARAVAFAGAGAAVTGSVVLVIEAGFGVLWSSFSFVVGLFAIFFAVFVGFVAGAQPTNRLLLVFAVSAGAAGWMVLGRAVTVLLVEDAALAGAATVIPADLPLAAAWVNMVTGPAWIGVFVPLLTFGFLAFPDGEVPSSRWRPVVWLSVAAMLMLLAGTTWSYRPSSELPDTGLVIEIGLLLWLVASVASVVALVRRYRESSGALRDQFKWIVWAGSIFVPALTFSVIMGDIALDLSIITLTIASLLFFGAYAVAVGRHRLFDVEVVIRRSIVVAGLVGFITVVYGAIVVAVGLLLGDLTEAAVPLSVAATVVVAIAFDPMRQRMRRWANRLVYGERATPYEVLAGFSAWMRDAVGPEDVLPRMVELLAVGTGASRAVAWISSGDELRPMAVWPEGATPQSVKRGPDGDIAIDGADHVAPVEHEGELLGVLSVEMPRGEELAANELRLVDDVASQAGLVVRNVMLTADLVETIGQLRSSRQRLVAAQDEERRRLERDIHDGAQQQLVALKMKIGLVERLTEGGDLDRARDILRQLADDATDAVEALRTLAHGIYPPLLEAEGLAAALNAQVRKAPIDVSVSAHGLRRYPPDVEAAVYFCVLEAIQNAVKYASVPRVAITLRDDGDNLAFIVSDDGEGFDPGSTPRGRGLTNMADRMDAIGGTLEVLASAGSGTTVTGQVRAESVDPLSGTSPSQPRR